MKTYACVVMIDLDDDVTYDLPANWNWSELIGPEVRGVTIFDVTDADVERVRITVDGAEEIC